MRLKQIPEDFVVKELSNVEISEGNYSYFRLKKVNRNTLDVVQQLARKLKIKEKKIGFAGSKDKHAVTEQVISVLGRKSTLPKIDKVSFEFLGQGSKPICLGDLISNSFDIVVRELEQFEVDQAEFITNYFDEQRFSKNNMVIGRCLIKKEFEEAVKLIGDSRLASHLRQHNNDFIGALKKLPIRLLLMYVHAYQSYLWNKTVEKFLRKEKVVLEIDYSLGTFVFVEERQDWKIPLIGFEEVEPEFANVISEVMKEENLQNTDFVIKQIPELSMEGELRDVFIPIDVQIGKIEKNDLGRGKKLQLSFTLPKGSYATMVIKRLIHEEII
jgi:tRNA pseudouridine13 synthase